MEHLHGLLYSTREDMTATALKNITSPLSPEEMLEIADLHRWTQENDIRWTMLDESDFHYKFLTIKSKPSIVYYQGNIDLLNQSILGIVGPRKHSPYASLILQKLFSHASAHQMVTISGLALGVDQLGHRLSLDHHIPTIAVLGGGLKRFLQSPDRHLIEEIVANGGLVLSEFKLSMKPETYTFPQRNRIIAGLSDVLFLPEAGSGSGSLITANFALDMCKPVYGVPNSIFAEQSLGINDLIAQGQVKMVTDFGLFLDRFFYKKNDEKAHIELPVNLSVPEKKIISLIAEKDFCTLSDLVRDEKSSSQEVMSLLTFLEMKQYIYQETPGVYKVSV